MQQLLVDKLGTTADLTPSSDIVSTTFTSKCQDGSSLRGCQRSRSTSRRTSSPAPQYQPSSPTNSLADMISNLVRQLRNARSHAIGKTPRPNINGDKSPPSSPGECPSRLVFIIDLHTHTHFLVDTSSEVSVVPPTSPARKHSLENLTLAAVMII